MKLADVKTELGFDRVLADLAKRVKTDLGAAALAALPFLRDAGQLNRELALLRECAERVIESGTTGFSGSGGILMKVATGRSGEVPLVPPELFALAEAVDAVAALSRTLDRNRFPALAAEIPDTADLRDVAALIRRAVDRDGTILDSASPALAAIRRKKAGAEGQADHRIREILRGLVKSGVAVEDFVTERNGRLVVPVVAGRANPDLFIVHDRSASGATLFVEPVAILALNNAVATLRLEEEAEKRRIVVELNDRVFAQREPMLRLLEATGRLDALQARALLVARDQYTIPLVAADGVMDLREARHPHLHDPIPISLSIGSPERHAVISGANAGGKTVTLKTFGLFALMFQTGIPLPCHPDSRLPVFEKVLVDIGDQQSIEENLSTFSAHVVSLVGILKSLSEGRFALVLLDELGVGSNPRQGSALACAVLTRLHDSNCISVTTTHYESLIELAARLERAVNCAVAFDPERVKPLYVIEKGRSGISHSLKIAEAYGMPADVLACARTFLTEEELRLEHLTEEMERRERALERERRRLLRAQERERKTRRALEAETELLRKKQEAAREEVSRTVAQDLAGKLARIDRLVAEAEGDAEKMSTTSKRGQIRRAAAEIREELAGTPAPPPEPAPKDPAEPGRPIAGRVGERVHYGKGRLPGTIVAAADGGNFRVEFESGITMELPGRDLLAVAGPPATGLIKIQCQPRNAVLPEFDIRGKSVEEALPLVDKYLDDALTTGYKEVRVVHGKGTQRLAEGIRKHLARRPGVAEARYGTWGEGDYGVTVVTFR